jgi:hypothetical protein
MTYRVTILRRAWQDVETIEKGSTKDMQTIDLQACRLVAGWAPPQLRPKTEGNQETRCHLDTRWHLDRHRTRGTVPSCSLFQVGPS